MKTISLSSKRFGRFPFLSFFLSFFLFGFLLSGAKTPEVTPLKENHAVCSNRNSCGCYVRYRIDESLAKRLWFIVYNAKYSCFPMSGFVEVTRVRSGQEVTKSEYIVVTGTGDILEINDFEEKTDIVKLNLRCSNGNDAGASTSQINCGKPFCYIDKSGSVSGGFCLYRFLNTGTEIVPDSYILLRDGSEIQRGSLHISGSISFEPHPNQELRMYNSNCGCRNPQAHYTTF